MIDRNEKHPLREAVMVALERYQLDINDATAGYAILRYAKQGLICATIDASQTFLDWYPSNPGYVILRLAKGGALSYKGKDSDE